MSDRSEDRHKGVRFYKSGGEKRQSKKEKLRQEQIILSQTRRLTDFLVPSNQFDSQAGSSSSSSTPSEPINENVENLVSVETKEIQLSCSCRLRLHLK